MAERRLHGLQRVLGVNALVATAYGNVGSSIYYALGLVAALALGLTPLVFLITGAFFFCTAATYAEATAMFPEAGGSSSFARRAFNELVSFFAAWAQLLNYVITIAISAYFVPNYLGGLFWDALQVPPGNILFGAGVIVLLAAVNVRGVKESAGLNIALAVVDFLTQVLLVLVGIVLVLDPGVLAANVTFGVAPTWKDFLLAIPIGMIAYTGIETISNMAEEARDERVTIPAAINRVRLAVFAIYFTLPAVALSALPVQRAPDGDYQTLLGLSVEDGGFAEDPILGVVEALSLGPFQSAGEIYVGLLAATILFIATNAAIIGVSRLVYSMGVYRQVPDRLRRLHPRYGTPWVGIIIFGAVAVVTLLPGQAGFLGNMYAFGAMLSFTVAHVAVVALRLREPDRERPYRGPGTLRVRGRELPVFAVVGGTGTGLAFVVVTALNPEVAAAGTLWLALGAVAYVIYRRRQGLDLTSTHRVALTRPVVEHEAEYESVLVAFEGDDLVAEVMSTAAKLAAQRRRGIHVLAIVTVPSASPIDADLPDQELAARAIVEQARVHGGRRVSGRVEKVRAGQAGRLIVDEARSLHARAVILPLAPRASGQALFPKTAQTVLAERPCRVIIESNPAAGRRRTEGRGTLTRS
ncbi:MAG: universal stress protein [Actinomycetota bacterium]|nr:universal stress protein [Actinomycetota bacterium]